MLGLAVLFFLGVWVIITLIAMWIGWRLGKKIPTKLLGAFLGFMLTMGGLIVYWVIDYHTIQSKISQLCEAEGGIMVYVTPEEWIEQIGNKEWHTLIPLTNSEIRDSNPSIRNVTYLGKKYNYTPATFRSGNIENSRIALYDYYNNYNEDNIIMGSHILANKVTGEILVRGTYFKHYMPAIANDLSSLKFWLNNIQDCSNYNKLFHNYAVKFSNIK